jgi:hypothetical protein
VTPAREATPRFLSRLTKCGTASNLRPAHRAAFAWISTVSRSDVAAFSGDKLNKMATPIKTKASRVHTICAVGPIVAANSLSPVQCVPMIDRFKFRVRIDAVHNDLHFELIHCDGNLRAIRSCELLIDTISEFFRVFGYTTQIFARAVRPVKYFQEYRRSPASPSLPV